jgi:hypothetical protein
MDEKVKKSDCLLNVWFLWMFRVLLYSVEPSEWDQTCAAPGAGGGSQLLPQPLRIISGTGTGPQLPVPYFLTPTRYLLRTGTGNCILIFISGPGETNFNKEMKFDFKITCKSFTSTYILIWQQVKEIVYWQIFYCFRIN